MKKKYTLKKAKIKSITFCCMLLIGYSVNAQNLNFTIDTAMDNGVSITETLTNGSDTYVLLIDVAGTGAETLFDLGGGDFVFYLGSSTTANTFIITLTKNGNPTNFKLNGIDYDTIEDGFISILNQDDGEISSNQEYVVGAGAINITNAANAANITEIKIIQPDALDNTDFAFHNISVDVLDTLSTEDFIAFDTKITIFPNPSNGNITINNVGIALNKMAITDINGRKVFVKNLNGVATNKSFDLSSELVAGMYFVSIFSDKGLVTKKIMIN